jgi:hypothetical protein
MENGKAYNFFYNNWLEDEVNIKRWKYYIVILKYKWFILTFLSRDI